MSTEITVIVHNVERDGVPDMEADRDLVGRIAYVWDGAIVSGWPIGMDVAEESTDLDLGVQYWEPSEGRMGGPVTGVEQWIELPYPAWSLQQTVHPEATDSPVVPCLTPRP